MSKTQNETATADRGRLPDATCSAIQDWLHVVIFAGLLAIIIECVWFSCATVWGKMLPKPPEIDAAPNE